MIAIDLPSGREIEPWTKLLAPARDAPSGLDVRARVRLSFTDDLPPPEAPTRDPAGTYRLPERDFLMEVASDGTVGVAARPNAPVPPAAPRHLISALAGPLGLTLLHGSAVVAQGRALVFCGRSGAGKTTIARELLAGVSELIDDEINFIAREDQGEPALLDTRDPAAALAALVSGPDAAAWIPLGGLFHLKQAGTCALREMPAAEATAALLTVPLLADDPETVSEHAGRLARIIERTPVRELSFTKDAAAVRALL